MSSTAASLAVSAGGFCSPAKNGHEEPISPSSPNGPGIFSLPYDVRYLIYCMVLQPEFPLRRWEHYMTCPGCNLDITGASIAKCTNLLLLNRQIYQEASPILHNVEHVIKALHGPSNQLWRQSALNHRQRPRRSGGVDKISELEARKLKRMIFDVTFKNASLRTISGSQISRNGSSSGWERWFEPGEADEHSPPVLEETVLKEQVEDLVRVLRSGCAIRKVIVRVKHWPRWHGSDTLVRDGHNEIHGCSKEEMLDVFRPLLELQVESGATVDVKAVVAEENEEGNPVAAFAESFNEIRVKQADSKVRAWENCGKEQMPVKTPSTPSEDGDWSLAAECRKCDQVFNGGWELKEHNVSTHCRPI